MRLVLDHADDTVLGLRGLRMTDTHSMLKGAARRLECLQVQIDCHVHAARHECAMGIVQVHVALRVTDYHIVFARVRDRHINIRHIQFSKQDQSYETGMYSIK